MISLLCWGLSKKPESYYDGKKEFARGEVIDVIAQVTALLKSAIVFFGRGVEGFGECVEIAIHVVVDVSYLYQDVESVYKKFMTMLAMVGETCLPIKKTVLGEKDINLPSLKLSASEVPDPYSFWSSVFRNVVEDWPGFQTEASWSLPSGSFVESCRRRQDCLCWSLQIDWGQWE